MVNNCIFIQPSNKVSIYWSPSIWVLCLHTCKTHEMKIRAWQYASDHRPYQVLVPTCCHFPPREVGPHFPFAESILDNAVVQPYVHDCIVNVKEGQHTHQFRVFYKWHVRLHTNTFLPMTDCVSMRGSMLVMRVAALDSSSIVNMRGHDTILADFLIGR